MTEAVIALGANLGRAEEALREAVQRLAASPGLEVRGASRLWRSEPFGLRDQPEFVNAAVLLGASCGPRRLLHLLLKEERRAGRTRGERFAPRLLDLDLLTYGDMILAESGLTLPHPGIEHRSFVLAPLAEAAPRWRHPVLGRPAAELLAELRSRGRATACRPIAGPALWPALGATACPG